MASVEVLENLQVIWDYLGLHMEPQKADWIIGFGNFNDNIARRAAELYHQGYATKVLFTGGLGRNTLGVLPEPEAVRFARVAMECGVPECDILQEDKSTNTAENILFTHELLKSIGLPHNHILAVHQPFMERRIAAALGVYWPEVKVTTASPRVTIPQYLRDSVAQGVTEQAAIEVIVGDFQRIDVYARRGYQLPQEIPQKMWTAFYKLVELGYGGQLVN